MTDEVDPGRHEKISKLIVEALELQPEKREAFLRRACEGDAELHAEVQSLLEQKTRGDKFDQMADRGQVFMGPGPKLDERPLPERIGPYRIIRRLGEGGMGEVFLAEQEEPVRREVALKVIRRDLNSDQVVSRFKAEQQALALMKHSNVARIYDSGQAEDGRAYFVMEFIRGEPITRYCDLHNLPAAERLQLVIQVCGGVQHAHQKGVIHRDLKPGNILVEIRDGKPIPKIIDFGVARATDRRHAERVFFTEHGQVIGTPEYMSPEQAEMSNLDIDTRTDIYSIGVVLYELLVGALPFDPARLRAEAHDQISRIIREETPHKPSTRLSSLGEGSKDVARHRSSDPASLVRLCRGDLDWITMKALEKDRTRRYDSASDLGEDLRHYLDNEPVSAGPPSVSYRVKKFVRRHRIGVSVATGFLALLALGFAGTAVGYVRAVRAEKQARTAQRTTQRISDFMFGTFAINDPSEARGRSVTAMEILDKATTKIRADEELRNDPAVLGALMHKLGLVYRGLGLYDESQRLLEEAVSHLERAYGDSHAEVSHVLLSLVGVLRLRREQGGVDEMLLRIQRIQDETLPLDDPARGALLNDIGQNHLAKKNYAEALRYFEEGLAFRARVLGPMDDDVAKMHCQIGIAKRRSGDFEGAKSSLELCLAIREERLEKNHPDLALPLTNLSSVYKKLDELEKAQESIERALAIQEIVYTYPHPNLVNSLVQLGSLEYNRRDYESAARHMERAVGMGIDMDPQHYLVPAACNALIKALQHLGEDDRVQEFAQCATEQQ